MSPSRPVSHAIQCVLWIWLHVLQFNVSNQVRDPEEDTRNKPWRPLPSGRITLANALILKYAMTVACLLVSCSYSTCVFMSSALFSLIIPIYHEMHGDQHWLSKNLMNSVGYACFATGSILVAGMYLSSVFSSLFRLSIKSSFRSVQAGFPWGLLSINNSSHPGHNYPSPRFPGRDR